MGTVDGGLGHRAGGGGKFATDCGSGAGHSDVDAGCSGIVEESRSSLDPEDAGPACRGVDRFCWDADRPGIADEARPPRDSEDDGLACGSVGCSRVDLWSPGLADPAWPPQDSDDVGLSCSCAGCSLLEAEHTGAGGALGASGGGDGSVAAAPAGLLATWPPLPSGPWPYASSFPARGPSPIDPKSRSLREPGDVGATGTPIGTRGGN